LFDWLVADVFLARLRVCGVRAVAWRSLPSTDRLAMGDIDKGAKLFKQRCAQCHTVEAVRSLSCPTQFQSNFVFIRREARTRPAPTCTACTVARPARPRASPTLPPTRRRVRFRICVTFGVGFDTARGRHHLERRHPVRVSAEPHQVHPRHKDGVRRPQERERPQGCVQRFRFSSPSFSPRTLPQISLPTSRPPPASKPSCVLVVPQYDRLMNAHMKRHGHIYCGEVGFDWREANLAGHAAER
jgi:hypothetical protein